MSSGAKSRGFSPQIEPFLWRQSLKEGRGGCPAPHLPRLKAKRRTQAEEGSGSGVSTHQRPAGSRHAHSTGSTVSCSRVMAPSKLAKQTRKDARRDAAAAHQLALWHYEGEEGLSEDFELYFKWELEAAERGYADAQFAVGEVYADGVEGFVQVDHARAIAWFRKAALQGRALRVIARPAPLSSLS